MPAAVWNGLRIMRASSELEGVDREEVAIPVRM